MPVKCSDIPDVEVLEACRAFHAGESRESAGEVLGRKYPEKVVYRKMESLERKGLLEMGSFWRGMWLTEAGKVRLRELRGAAV